jgi:chloramphenicol 3-O-phosphotransferase
MIVWLNGAFGAGKTSTARELAGMLAGVRQFDPEWVGYMLKAAARSWMETAADLVVDSTALSVAEVAKTVAAAVQPVLDRD